MSARALTRDEVRLALRRSVHDGVLWAAMVGLGDTYFVADAIRHGATPYQVALVACLPLAVGALGPLIALRILARLPRRRGLVVVSAVLQALGLAALALVDGGGGGSAELVIAIACLHQVVGQAGGTAWASWYGDLVPARMRGRYFSRRNRLVHTAAFLGLLAGGLLLQALEPAIGTAESAAGGAGLGYAVAFGLAALMRLGSAARLAASPEPPFAGTVPARSALRLLATRRGVDARRLVLSLAALQFAVCLAAPSFAPRMLEELRFTYLEYTLAAGAVVAAKFVLAPAWGRILDGQGARGTTALAAAMLALIPLPWLLVDSLGGVLLAQILSGASWAGYEVGQFALLVENSTRRTRPHVFAANSLVVGSAQLAGALVGAELARRTGDLRVLFGASLLARLAVALALPRFLPRTTGPPARRRDLLLRLVGVRPGGGPLQRPLAIPAGTAEGNPDPLGPDPRVP